MKFEEEENIYISRRLPIRNPTILIACGISREQIILRMNVQRKETLVFVKILALQRAFIDGVLMDIRTLSVRNHIMAIVCEISGEHWMAIRQIRDWLLSTMTFVEKEDVSGDIFHDFGESFFHLLCCSFLWN